MDINYDCYWVFDYITISRCSPFRLRGRTLLEKLITVVSSSSPGRTSVRIGSVNLFLSITNCQLVGSYSFRNFRAPKKPTARTRFAVGRVIYSRHYVRLCVAWVSGENSCRLFPVTPGPQRHVYFMYRINRRH